MLAGRLAAGGVQRSVEIRDRSSRREIVSHQVDPIDQPGDLGQLDVLVIARPRRGGERQQIWLSSILPRSSSCFAARPAAAVKFSLSSGRVFSLRPARDRDIPSRCPPRRSRTWSMKSTQERANLVREASVSAGVGKAAGLCPAADGNQRLEVRMVLFQQLQLVEIAVQDAGLPRVAGVDLFQGGIGVDQRRSRRRRRSGRKRS